MYFPLLHEKRCSSVVKPAVTLSLILMAISFLMLVLLQFYESSMGKRKQEFSKEEAR
jgi:ABC-type sulfate transport system permease component